MSLEIDVRNGDESWPDAKPLVETAFAASQFKHISWADADLRVLLETPDEGLVCHVGLYFRVVVWNGRKMHIGGIGGLSTHPDHRRKGYASVALNAAIQSMRDREDVQFALLFCEPHNDTFYQARGWHAFDGDVYVEQPEGRVTFTAMKPLIHDFKRGPRQGTIDLCGLPW